MRNQLHPMQAPVDVDELGGGFLSGPRASRRDLERASSADVASAAVIPPVQWHAYQRELVIASLLRCPDRTTSSGAVSYF
jgi:hypothetical protein